MLPGAPHSSRRYCFLRNIERELHVDREWSIRQILATDISTLSRHRWQTLTVLKLFVYLLAKSSP